MITQRLKNLTPKTWEQFRNYLRENYEFWDKNVNEETLWFCERPFKHQLGYFIDWFDKLNIKDERDIFFTETEHDTMLEDMEILIFDVFTYLEATKFK